MPRVDDLDRRAGRRRGVERLDDLRVDERVDLDPDPRRLAGRARPRATRAISCEDPVAQEPRADEELAEDRRLGQPGDRVEDVGDVGGDLLVGGEEAEVLVVRRVRRVVVAGADMRVAAQPAPLAADEQRELRVHLQIRHAVDDVDARALERPRPLDVAPLVEARLQLDEADGLLALLGRLDERGERRRGVVGAVDGRLRAPTFGSRAARRTRSTLVSNESYGWWTRCRAGGSGRAARRRAVRERPPRDRLPRRVLQLGPVELAELAQRRRGRAARALAVDLRRRRSRARRQDARRAPAARSPRPRAGRRRRSAAAAAESRPPRAGRRRHARSRSRRRA